ncbi:folate family ECF transporter S component [Tepidimicrobium xylanilyticum]|uniref:ECF transporter S component, folate family n=1 Tax=Tepidimicrobium xylanilyticum TaxID=1123352 RepID=A0A1H2SX97_9FIRM|nr:folate family ECF transporter S component [Tepidimicrobium xylanilyticum]GMG96102.1 histidine kinase [Tepidimicrobium xylanilyticum]SDW35659.1 ECF transporter S component, folate family [Tepidimicrobium xylanilyticum]
MRRLNTRNIAYYALLIGLNVVLTRVGSIRIGGGGLEIIRIGFGGFPIIFAGIVFGPVAGAIVGAIGDIIGMIISPIGPYMPHFTLNAALTGVIPGLIMMRCKDKDCKTSFINLFVAIAVGQVITSIVLWAYFMRTLFSIPLATILPGRIISQLVNIPIYSYMMKVILSRLPLALDTK